MPKKLKLDIFCHPPIFSGVPNLNLTLSQSYHPPSFVYEVVSRLTPGRNCNLVSGILFVLFVFYGHPRKYTATPTAAATMIITIPRAINPSFILELIAAC